MEISSSSLELRLAMVEIQELKPHEEVIETLVAKLTNEMRQDALVRDPLIVDREDRIILDGMHRFSSLKHLKCRFAPCCLIDYMSPQITVGSWFRAFTVEDPKSVAQEVLRSMKLDYSVTQLATPDLTFDPAAVILTKDGNEFFLHHSMDALEQSRTAASIEKQMVRSGHQVTYLADSVAIESLGSERANFVIALPVFTKQMVRKFGSGGILLPHKVTRHVIPSRPMEIDVPLSLLTDTGLSLPEADEKLDDLLERRRIERRPPGSVIDGRRYDEELIVFSP